MGLSGVIGECMGEAGLSMSAIGAFRDDGWACWGWRDRVLVEKGSDGCPLSSKSGINGGKTKVGSDGVEI